VDIEALNSRTPRALLNERALPRLKVLERLPCLVTITVEGEGKVMFSNFKIQSLSAQNRLKVE